MSADFEKLREIFHEAVDRHPPDQWEAYLDRACADNEELRRQAAALLRAHEHGLSVLGPGGTESETTGSHLPAAAETSGASIGPYKLLQQIGEGGMGTVFMAEQTRPVQRRVALKIIKPGMDSRQVIARFEAERQALALMDHANIARILDGGTTESGRPYFVMELVHGVPITRYCDDNRLSPRERLGLFVQVCQAVQHAHQKGIIHRDLKPSNVMITLYDGRPVPKVIDFGVAKATEQKLTERTLFTQYGTMVGTLEYMSPEQAEMSALGVDTRSDIYSLGVLLYELLTGSTPLTHQQMKEAAYAEILRMIKEEEPPKPSTRLSDSGEALASISAKRHMEPAKLTKLVRGELDWIVMKTLEKDRNRRYETVVGLAADVQRYLDDEPVQACPPSAGYRLRKFTRRNRGPVLAAAIILFLLVGGIVGTTVGLVQAKRAKDTAEKRLAQVEKGIDILGSLFEDLDPFAEEKEGRPLRAILGDRLDQATAALEGEAVGDPLVVARLQERLGQTYLGLGQGAKAEAQFTKVLATRQALLGADHPLTLESMHNQAVAYESAGKRLDAIKRFELVHVARVKVLGADHPDTLSSLNGLATVNYRAGNAAEAIPLLEQVRDGRVKLFGENHDDTLATLNILASAYAANNKHPQAIALAEKVWEARLQQYGDGHPHAIAALNNLAWVYQRCYRMKQALALFERARDTTVPKLGPYHPETLKILEGLAHMYRVYQRTPEAIALFEPVLERKMMVLGGHHPSTLGTLLSLAMSNVDAGVPDKALPLFQQAATGVERLQFAHDDADQMVHNLANCHEQLNQFDEAEGWRRKWVAVAKAKYGPESFEYVGIRGLTGLGSNLVYQEKYAEAEPMLRESLAILQKKSPGDWQTFRTQLLLGTALLGQEKYADAEPHLWQGFQGMKKSERDQGTRHYGLSPRQRLTEVLERVVRLYEAWGNPSEATKWRTELEAMTKAAEQPTKLRDK
jgi:serine/threonine protein kinase/tetratricopeptide (TPR) repeat protein